MSNKLKRKVTLDKPKDNPEPPRRTSVFDRLGPGTLNLPLPSQDRPSRAEQNEKCRNWLRTGVCSYGNTCRYQHESYSGNKRPIKPEKEVEKKDFRHKARKRSKDNAPKESRTGSLSPKRKQGAKRSTSRSRKGEHESKIKSTVVISRPRSPPHPVVVKTEPVEEKKEKADPGTCDDDSDGEWDAAQLDYKEELTLERRRQRLQRELEMEIQKEKMMSENASYTGSSSSSSSSDSGSISSSSDSSSSSSDEDSDDSSSSSTSSSSSDSQAPSKKKYKKTLSKKPPETSSTHKKTPENDKAKSKHSAKSTARFHSPPPRDNLKKKGRDKRNRTPSPSGRSKNRLSQEEEKSESYHVRKGPRTPSPPPPNRKQRQWTESSSADSRSADIHRNRGKRHKKKKDSSWNEVLSLFLVRDNYNNSSRRS